MEKLFVLRGKLQEIYAKYSRVFDKVCQFFLALVTFYMINNNIGFMKMLAQPVVTLALAVICTFFPLLITVITAAIVIMGHMYAASIGMLLVTSILFFAMFVFYLRLTPQKAIVVLLTPIAFMVNLPYVIPIACALVSGPITVVAIICGTIVYYMMQYVKKATPTLRGEEATGMMTQISAYVKQVFQNKQMWIIIIAFIICFLLVYTIRRQALDHAWKIAIAAGAVANIVIIAGGNIAMGTNTEYGSLIIGSIMSVIVGIVLEFFFFSVDYAKSESVQFEDDEYYYYVKAVPKLAVQAQEKTVKRINERQEMDEINDFSPGVDDVEVTDVTEDRKTGFNIFFGRLKPVKGPNAKIQNMAQSLKKDLGLED